MIWFKRLEQIIFLALRSIAGLFQALNSSLEFVWRLEFFLFALLVYCLLFARWPLAPMG